MFCRSCITSSLGEFQLGQQDVADDPGEQIIEIMGNTAGKQPHGFELLRAPQFLFHAQLFSDVPEYAPQRHGPACFQNGS